MITDCLHLFILGESKSEIDSQKEEQETQIQDLLLIIHDQNDLILPALLDPNPLLSHERTAEMKIILAAKVVENIYKYFQRMQGAKQTFVQFLYPNHQNGQPYPPYIR